MDVFQGTDASPLPNRIKRSKLTEGQEWRWIYRESCKRLMSLMSVPRQCGVSFLVATFLRRFSPTSILRTACDSIFMLLILCVHEMCSCHVFKCVSFCSGFGLGSGDQGSKMVSLVENLWICVRCQFFSARKSWVLSISPVLQLECL